MASCSQKYRRGFAGRSWERVGDPGRSGPTGRPRWTASAWLAASWPQAELQLRFCSPANGPAAPAAPPAPGAPRIWVVFLGSPWPRIGTAPVQPLLGVWGPGLPSTGPSRVLGARHGAEPCGSPESSALGAGTCGGVPPPALGEGRLAPGGPSGRCGSPRPRIHVGAPPCSGFRARCPVPESRDQRGAAESGATRACDP